jgi:NB-ARC domain-containing protein
MVMATDTEIKNCIGELEEIVSNDRYFFEAYHALKEWFIPIQEDLDEHPAIPHPLKHGISHAGRVIFNCWDILRKSHYKISKPACDYEIAFIILCSGYLHDIGMQIGFEGNDRKHHAETSARVIQDIQSRARNLHGLALPESSEARNILCGEIMSAIAFIVRLHNKPINLPEYRNLEAEYVRSHPEAAERYRTILLAALLKTADMLHMDCSRVDEKIMKGCFNGELNLELADMARVFYCYYVDGINWQKSLIEKTGRPRWDLKVKMSTPYERNDEDFELLEALENVYEKRTIRRRRDALYILEKSGIVITTDPNPEYALSAHKEKMPRKLQKFLLSEKSAGSGLVYSVPAPTPHFVGRDRIITDIKNSLKTRKCIVLVGAPGIGKTELSIRVAEEVRDHFDKVVFVKTATMNVAEGVFLEMKSALGVDSGLDVEHFAESIKLRNVLIIVDNLEDACHTDRDGVKKLFEYLIDYTHKVRFLLTSRRDAHIKDAMLREVRELSPGKAADLFIRLCQDKDVDTTPWAGNDIDKLLEKLSHMPLPITLVASRMNAIALDEMTRRLENECLNFMEEAGISETDPDKDCSVRASISLSYKMLSGKAGHAMACLSFFPNGVSLWEIEDGIGFSDFKTIEELFGNRLLKAIESGNYVMLEPIRLFAEERFESFSDSEKNKFRGELIDYYSSIINDLGPQVLTATGKKALDDLDLKHLNIYFFLKDFFNCPNDQKALRIIDCVDQLDRYFISSGRHGQFIDLIWSAKDLAHNVPYLKGEANCLSNLGSIAFIKGNNSQVEDMIKKAIKMYELIEEPVGQGNCFYLLGRLSKEENKRTKAIEYAKKSLYFYQKGGHEHNKQMALSFIKELSQSDGGDSIP